MLNNHKDILNRAELPTQPMPMCLRTDKQREFEAATRRLADAIKANDDADSLGGGPHDVEAIAREIREIEEAMEADTIMLTFRAVRDERWDELVVEHPPREEDAKDAEFGFNRRTFYQVLARESLIEPDFDPGDWRQFWSVVTSGQRELLTDVLWNLNRLRVMPVPFSPAASQILRSSASASKQQSDSDTL